MFGIVPLDHQVHAPNRYSASFPFHLHFHPCPHQLYHTGTGEAPQRTPVDYTSSVEAVPVAAGAAAAAGAAVGGGSGVAGAHHWG